MSYKRLSAALITAACLVSCTYTTQLSSGADYLERYNAAPAYTTNSKLDRDVRNIASIEPNLVFPARIGLARIEQGQLTTIPIQDAQHWTNLAERIGPSYGEMVPISPLIASMVDPTQIGQSGTHDLIGHIRKGAARQHVDYVLIYEVTDISKARSNALRLTDLTVLGLFVMPSRKVDIDATASAILIDVRNGYPYGTATAFAEKSALVTAAGTRSLTSKLSDTAKIQAVKSLTTDIEEMMQDLKDEAYAQLVQSGY